jgi:hypothetical protein
LLDDKGSLTIGSGSVIKGTDPKVTVPEHCLFVICFHSDPLPFRLCFFFRKRGGSADSIDGDNTDGEEEEEKDTEPELTDKEESGGEDLEPAAKRRAARRIQDEDSDHTQELFPDDL